MNLIEKAILYATNAHEGQKRKGSKLPYICHPFTTGMYLQQQNCSEEVIAAGILHDTVEDTCVTLEDIKIEFGEKVAQYVNGASEPDKSLSWEERKTHTIGYLKDAPLEIRLVSCADKLHNLKCILDDYNNLGEELWTRFNRKKEQQVWYYKELAKALCYRDDIPKNITLFEQYKQAVDEFLKLVS